MTTLSVHCQDHRVKSFFRQGVCGIDLVNPTEFSVKCEKWKKASVKSANVLH